MTEVLARLEAKGLKLACAESLTGGLLASTIVDIPGASRVFLGGVVAYDNAIKTGLLGVSGQALAMGGAVDAAVAVAMADGIRESFSRSTGLSMQSIIGLSTTGVAGPEIQDGKPAGTVFIAISGLGDSQAIQLALRGGRQEIRRSTVQAVIEQLADRL